MRGAGWDDHPVTEIARRSFVGVITDVPPKATTPPPRIKHEDDGLDGLKDRSSRPHESPNTTEVDVVAKIVYLRQTYHFGPSKIAMYCSDTTR